MKKKLCLIASVMMAGTTFSQTSISLKDSSYTYANWDESANNWDYTRRNIYNYNSSYEEIGNRSANLAGTGWLNDENAKDYLYDASHRLLEVSYERWAAGTWMNDHHETNTYDAAGNVLTKTQQTWSTGAWRNTTYSSFTYSGTNCTNALYQYWDNGSSTWINMMRTTSTYAGNQLTLSVDESWSAGSWTNDTRRTNFVYTGSDLSSYELQSWNSGSYDPQTKITNTYDANHHLLTSLTHMWNTTSAGWDNMMKSTYTYDAHWNQTVILGQGWDAVSGSWKNSNKIMNYYTTGTVGITRLSDQEHINLYPNPATDLLRVSAPPDKQPSTLIITDLSGKTVLSIEKNQAGPLTIDIGFLVPGMYFMELRNEQGSAKGKFIKN